MLRVFEAIAAASQTMASSVLLRGMRPEKQVGLCECLKLLPQICVCCRQSWRPSAAALRCGVSGRRSPGNRGIPALPR